MRSISPSDARLGNALSLRLPATRYHRWVAWAVLFVGLMATALASLAFRSEAIAAAQREFEFGCIEIQNNLTNKLAVSAQVLRSGAAFFDTHETVSRQEWRVFVERTDISQNLQGVQGVGFAQLIPATQLKQHVQAIRREQFANYQVWPAGPRPLYSAVVYLEPFSTRNQRAFGFDMLTESSRRAAMERARDENTVALSGKVALKQETAQDIQAGALAYVPVFQKRWPIDTVEQRRAAIRGWVYSPYRMEDLVDSTLGGWHEKRSGLRIALQIYDGEQLTADALLFDSQADEPQAPTPRIRLSPQLVPMDFAGRRWTLRFEKLSGLTSAPALRNVWLTLSAGTLGSFLLFGLLLSLRDSHVVAQALLLSEHRHRTILQTAMEGYWLCDVKGRLLDVNEAYCQMSGFSKPELLTMSVLDLVTNGTEATVATRIQRIMSAGAMRFGSGHRRKNGTIFDTEVSVAYWPAEGGRMAVFIRDVTEARRAAAAEIAARLDFERFFLVAPDLVVIASADGYFKRVNPAWERALGFTTQELLSMPYESLIHPDDIADTRQTVSDQMRGGTTLHFVNRYRAKDGSYRWLDWHASPADDSLLYATARDVTDERQAVSDRRRLEAELAQAHKMELVGRLAGGVAHDFNNMLAVIMGHTELARATVDATFPLGEHLAAIQSASDRAARVTRQLLSFARRQTIAPQVLNLNQTVSGGLTMLGRLIGENVSIDCVYGADLWPVRIDPTQVEQALVNLCLNARDAIAGVGIVSIRTANRSCDDDTDDEFPGANGRDYVRLEVSDNGHGMDTETLAHMFEPFFTTKDVGKGTGLGLASVFGAITQNGGGVTIRSQPAIGTTVTICLPRHLGNVALPAVERPAKAFERSEGTILLVEDEPALVKLIGIALTQLGYTVMLASTPSEATQLATASAGEIHLLLTDVIMPGMNGSELAQHLLTLRPGLKCLFMSGYSSEIIRSVGLKTEFEHFIQKPFSMNDLTAKVREALGATRPRAS